MRRHATCIRGHQYQYCMAHSRMVPGHSDHALPLDVCVCPKSVKDEFLQAPLRCAACGTGPTSTADIRVATFDIPRQFNLDYALCADCRIVIGGRIRDYLGTVTKAKPKEDQRNLLI